MLGKVRIVPSRNREALDCIMPNTNGRPDFHGMDPDLFQRSLTILANKGRAQVFGSEDQLGVKFF